VKLNSLSRPLAAAAVAGIAIIGFATSASATTVSVSVPGITNPGAPGSGVSVPGLLGGSNGNPVVAVGGNPVVTVGSGTVAPVPGVDAASGAHAGSDANVNNPLGNATSDATGTMPVPITTPGGPLVSEHSRVDACIAAAVLSGHSIASCDATAGGSPSLVSSLSQVGACVRLALASGQAANTCSSASPASPLSGIDDGSATSMLSGIGDGSATNPLSGISDGSATDTLNDALADNGLCAIAQQLGLADLVTCDTSGNGSVASIGTDAHNGSGHAGTAANTCLGLALVSGVDGSPCAHPADGTVQAQANSAGQHGTVKARHDGKSANLGTAASPNAGSGTTNVLGGSCVSSNSVAGSSAPVSSGGVGGIAGFAPAAAALLKRVKAARLA
jgi:hypothetical protein